MQTFGMIVTAEPYAIFGIDRKTPLELFEARNAVRIARNASAEKYAAASLSKAAQQLQAAEDAYCQKRNRKSVEDASREGRVELVVNGDAIGKSASNAIAVPTP
jgi:diphthamide biosynthesis methyltransferase